MIACLSETQAMLVTIVSALVGVVVGVFISGGFD